MQKERDFMLLMTYISNILIYIYAISVSVQARFGTATIPALAPANCYDKLQ